MFDINSEILSASGLTADQINTMVAGHGLAGLGQSFLDIEAAYGINAYFSVAHAIIESNWGDSWFAVNRNNLFGLDAYDSNPMLASSYPTKEACIQYYGHFLKSYYLTPGGAYFNGSTPHGVFVRYSSSHDTEAQSVVGVMNQLQEEANGGAASAPAGAAQPVPSTATPIAAVNSSIYTVQPGDNMSNIASRYGMTLDRLKQLNPQAGHPTGNFDVIWPGDTLSISGANPPAVPDDQAAYISVPSGYDGYLSVIAQKYGTTVDQLLQWNQGTYPSMTADYVQAGWIIRVR